MQLSRKSWPILGILAVCGALHAPAADKDPAAWAPPAALAYVGVTDVNQFWKDVEASPGFKAMQDPALKDLGSRFAMQAAFIDQLKKRVAKAIDIEPDKLKSPFGGGLAFYVPLPASAKSEPEPVLVAGIGDADLMKSYYDKAVKKMRDGASKYESETIGSNKVDLFSFEKDKKKDSDKPDPEHDDEEGGDNQGANEQIADQLIEQFFSKGMPEKLALCMTENKLIVAATKEQIQDALRRERGGDSLATSDDYKQFERQFKVAGGLRYLLNIRKLIELSVENNEESGKKTVDALGAKAFRNLIGQIVYDGKKYDYMVEAVLLMSGERTGLAKILSMKNRDLAAPPSTTPDTCMSFSFNLSFPELVDEIERITRQIDPSEADQMHESMSNVELGPDNKIDLRKDLFDNLREPIVVNLGFAKPYDPSSTQGLLSIGVKNKEAVDRVIAKIAEATGQLKDRDLRGNRVYDIPIAKVSIAVTSSAVLAGSIPAVESALTGGSGSSESGLAADATFKRALEQGPKQASALFYVDSRRMMEAVFEIAKDPQSLMMSAMANPLNMIPASMAEAYGELKPEQREKAKKMLDYMGAGIGTLTTTEDGLRFSLINLLPAK